MRSRFLSTFEAHRSANPQSRKHSTRERKASIDGREQLQNDDNQPVATFSSSGKRIGFQINLRSAQENALDGGSEISRSISTANAELNGRKRAIPEKFRDYRSGAEEILQIVQTRHIPEDEGEDTVILTLRGKKGEAVGEETSSDVRWIHINSDAMDFTAFQAYALNAPGLLNDDKALILRLLKKVRTTSERRWVHGRYFEPIAMRYSGKDPNQDAEIKSAMFCCIPYFSLGQYNSSNFTRESFVHPIRTLLQSRYRLEATEKRDKQQVIRKLGRPEHDGILHVPQLWCLAINKNTIITCAPMDFIGLHGTSIQTTPYTKSPTIEGPSCVRFTDLDGRLFFLPLEQCRTWFELIGKVLQVCPDLDTTPLEQLPNEYRFVNQYNQPVTDKNWRRLVDSEKSAFVHLCIQWNSNSDHIYLDSTSESETHSMSSDSSEGEAEKDRPQNGNQDASGAVVGVLSRGEYSGPANILKGQKTVGFETQPRNGRPPFAFDPSPSFLAENIHGKKSSHDRFYPKSLGREDSHYGVLNLGIGSRNNTFTSRDGSPDPQALDVPPVGEVNWENVNWEPKKPRRRRTEEEEPRGHRDFKLFRVPTLDRNTGRKHSNYHSHTLRSYPESTRRNHTSRLSRPLQEDINDIYWEPPSHRPSLMPSVSISGVTPKSNETGRLNGLDDGSSRSTAAPRKGRANSTRLNPRLTKGSLKTAPRSVSPSPSNGFVLPIFTWPTVSSSSVLNLPRDPRPETNLAVPMSHDLADRPRSIVMDDQTLAVILADVNDQLSNRKGKGRRHVYEDTTESTIQDVEAAIEFLEKEIVEMGDHENKTEAPKISIASVIFEEKKQILNQAKKLSDAFIPANYRCSITNKYWGAIYSIITAKRFPRRHHSRENELQHILDVASDFSKLLEAIQAGVYAGNDPQCLQYRVPRSLVKAYQQLVMFFVYSSVLVSSTSSKDLESKYVYALRDECEGHCKNFLIEGKHELILMIHTNDYRGGAGYEAVNSEALIALVMEGLLNVSSRDGDFDLTEIYGEYLIQLEGKAQEHPSVRVFEDIKYLSEELEIIGKTLASQRLVLEDFYNLNNRNRDVEVPSAHLSNGVTRRCTDNIDQRISEFEELLIQALNTQFLAAQSISLKAESNNKAILIFTIVTIIFLPLSFITSYLGMNTIDIRTTDSGQGLFWSIALPMTFVILTVVVFVAYQKPWMRQRVVDALGLKFGKLD